MEEVVHEQDLPSLLEGGASVTLKPPDPKQAGPHKSLQRMTRRWNSTHRRHRAHRVHRGSRRK